MEEYPVEEITLGGPEYRIYEDGKLLNLANYEWKNPQAPDNPEPDYTLYDPKSKARAHLHVEFVGWANSRQFIEADKAYREYEDSELEDCMMPDMYGIAPGYDFLREEDCAKSI